MRLPTDRYVMIDNLRLRYWLEGNGGPNLVLIHGIGGSVDVWRKQFDGLACTHRVLAVDLPGCGRSAIPPSYPPDTLRLLAAAVRGVMQAVGMTPATLSVLRWAARSLSNLPSAGRSWRRRWC
jgi:pimeloyl-ACP methyl ester carboxylesterase